MVVTNHGYKEQDNIGNSTIYVGRQKITDKLVLSGLPHLLSTVYYCVLLITLPVVRRMFDVQSIYVQILYINILSEFEP